MATGKTICAFASVLSVLLLISFVFANSYYWYTSQSISVGLVLLPFSDINQDGTVDMFDLEIVVEAYGSQSSDPNWNQFADLNKDNLVDMFDVFIVARDYGWSI